MERTIFHNKFAPNSDGRVLQASINSLENIITNYEAEEVLFKSDSFDDKMRIGVYREKDCMNINGTDYYNLISSVLYDALDELALSYIKKRLKALRKEREELLTAYNTLINS